MMNETDKKNWGLLLLRVGVGVVFAMHGWEKINGIEGVVGMFAGLGLPAFVAWAVAIGEFVGGLALIVGVWSDKAGYLLALIMLGAIVYVHGKNGFMLANGGYEYALVLLTSSLAVAKLGPGALVLKLKK